MKSRLDKHLLELDKAHTRSQAESYIRLGKVKVNGDIETKAGRMVSKNDKVEIHSGPRYVSRAALKLESVADGFGLDFDGKTVLDIGSSTGGFSDFALQNGAAKAIAVDVGTKQMHPKLRGDKRVELHEKTDIRTVWLRQSGQRTTSKGQRYINEVPDIILVDVSFISLREILPHVSKLMDARSELIAMVKPQFETGSPSQKNKGVIKNEKIRRQIMADFELWTKSHYYVAGKADSQITGEKGNRERFYKLILLQGQPADSI